jgi:uncharacterized membrane protein YhaH (DUF805 family)
MNLLTMLFDFRGRINRAKFCLSVLIWVVFFFLVIGAGMATGSMNAMFALALLAYIPIIVSAIAVGMKRLHDRNKSAWWLLVFYGIPIVLPFLAAVLGGGFDESSSTGSIIMQYVTLTISLWALIELGCLRGTIGGNPHGPDPVAPKPAQH